MMYASIPENYRSEQVFIREIWFEPNDLSARLIYADWLEEHNDVRAEILRNDVQLFELNGQTSEAAESAREKLIEKRRKLLSPSHWEWVALVGCAPIDPCIQWYNAHEPIPEFATRCPKRWENLQAIGDDSNVRFCSECQRSVHYCWDLQTAHKHARSGNCVALDPSASREPYDADVYTIYDDRREELGELL